MKTRLRIGEFAALKNVTTETLRHYDRVGLLEPMYIDEDTKYRYYSIFQSEKLASIIDLKAAGFSIDEMKVFFDQRQMKKTRTMLDEKCQLISKRIEELQIIEKSLRLKVKHLDEVMKMDKHEGYVIKKVDRCLVAYVDEKIINSETYDVLASDLENKLTKILPVISSNAYGHLVPLATFLKGRLSGDSNLIYFIDDPSEAPDELHKYLPASDMACFVKRGRLGDHIAYVKDLLEQLEREGYRAKGEVIVRIVVDDTITDDWEEKMYQVQIPIEKY